MKKALLLCAVALFSHVGRVSAEDGLTAVGANIVILPSSYWDGEIEWKAWTWVYNSGEAYGDWNSWNSNYNQLCGLGPTEDSEGRLWYEPDFDMSPKEDDMNWHTDEPIVWEIRSAPFSTDETFNGRTSYQWTSSSIMADIYVRRIFTIDPSMMLAGPVYLACGHDDAPAEYYINGELVFERTGFEGEREVYDENGVYLHTEYANAWNNAEYILLTDEQKALLKLNGEENVISFHVHQNWGGAFADCGLYTKMEGGLDMGYTTPWEGKVLFNNTGGYNNDMASPSNNPYHPWSALYEAQEGDEYTFTLLGSSNTDDTKYDEQTDEYVNIGTWREQLHFKSPIKIEEDHDYAFKVWLGADKPFTSVIVKLTDNDDDGAELAYEVVEIPAPVEGEEYEGKLVEIEFDGQAPATYVTDPQTGEEIEVEHPVNNFKIAFDFGGGEEGATVTIKDISLVDLDFENEEEETEEKELWVGTHYFNYFDMHKRVVRYVIWDQELNDGNGAYRDATEDELEWADEEITYQALNAPEVTGRVETLAWTQVDFDDTMWDNQMMPTGSAGYMPEQQSIWPSGIGACYGSSNYWIRRNFELEKINDRLSYELNVCHDDVYETYVNGHLLQKNVGWTDGKSPAQVHIPAKYLNVGKNVIATYIQQNWGGYFYDCGINVTEVNYEEAIKLFNDAIAYAKTDTLLTNRMKADVQAVIDEAMQFYRENSNDPVELRNYVKEFKSAVNNIFRHSSEVKILKDTYDICRKMEDKGYWRTTLDDVAIALDTCSAPSQWSGALANLRNARKATAMERHTEKFVGCVPESVTIDNVGDWDNVCPKYYLYNVGAKNFLGGGEAFGAHLALEYVSTPVMLINAVRDIYDEDGWIIDEEEIEGGYFIETFRPNGDRGVMDFMGRNGFIDVPMETVWELVPVEGKENVYNIARYGETFPTDTTYTEGGEMVVTGGGKVLLGLRNGDNALGYSYNVIDTDNKTPELETNQWMFVTREEMLALIPSASEDNPVDISFLINNPAFDSRLSYNDEENDWVWTSGGPLNYVMEAYNTSDFNLSQRIQPKEGLEALPDGTYMLTVQGYYRDGVEKAHLEKVLNNQPVNQPAVIFAGATDQSSDGETMPLMPIHIDANKVPGIGYEYRGMRVPGTQNGQSAATLQANDDYFPCGLYMNQVVFTVDDTFYGLDTYGDLKRQLYIGIDKFGDNISSQDWVVVDNWRLKYYGNGDIDPDAIRGIESDEISKYTPASKGIYNMLGQRLNRVQKGVNIIGGKKIAVK
jgi:hypothetical protein